MRLEEIKPLKPKTLTDSLVEALRKKEKIDIAIKKVPINDVVERLEEIEKREEIFDFLYTEATAYKMARKNEKFKALNFTCGIQIKGIKYISETLNLELIREFRNNGYILYFYYKDVKFFEYFKGDDKNE